MPQSEEEMTPKEREQRRRDIADPGPGCSITDPQGNVVYAGPAVTEVYDKDGNLVMVKPRGKEYRATP